MGNMQDGFVTSGACEVQEDPDGVHTELLFARLDSIAYPRPLRIDSELPATSPEPQSFKQNALKPVFAKAVSQFKDTTPPPPTLPCSPTIAATNTGTGTVNLALTTTGCDATMGFRIYGAEGSGVLGHILDAGSSTGWVHRNVIPGRTQRYAVSAYNGDNAEGALSPEVSLIISDTTPPAIPQNLAGLAGDTLALLEWEPGWERDLLGFNIYSSNSPSGPYVKRNGIPIPGGATPNWAQLGLNNGQTYYYKITAVDLVGNESGLTDWVSVTPSP